MKSLFVNADETTPGRQRSQAAETSAISRHGTIKKKTSSMSAPSSIGTSLRRNWHRRFCFGARRGGGRQGLSAGEKSSSRKNSSIYSLLMRTTCENRSLIWSIWFGSFFRNEFPTLSKSCNTNRHTTDWRGKKKKLLTEKPQRCRTLPKTQSSYCSCVWIDWAVCVHVKERWEKRRIVECIFFILKHLLSVFSLTRLQNAAVFCTSGVRHLHTDIYMRLITPEYLQHLSTLAA